MKFGVQLYSFRHLNSLSEILKMISQEGFRWVEPIFWPGQISDPVCWQGLTFGQIMDQVDAAGLRCPSVHLNLQAIKEEQDSIVRRCLRSEVSRVVLTWGIFQAEWQWRNFAKELEGIAQSFGQKGVQFLYHNHVHELQFNFSGKKVIELLLDDAPSLKWQFDVGAAFHAGVDVESFLKVYRERIVSLHLKDVDQMGRQPNNVGGGIVPLERLIAVAKDQGITDYIVEQNGSPSDAQVLLRSAAELWSRCGGSLA